MSAVHIGEFYRVYSPKTGKPEKARVGGVYEDKETGQKHAMLRGFNKKGDEIINCSVPVTYLKGRKVAAP